MMRDWTEMRHVAHMVAECVASDSTRLHDLGRKMQTELADNYNGMAQRLAQLEAENEALRYKVGRIRDIMTYGA